MTINTIILGDFQTNCYVLRTDAQASECVIIDAGLSPEPLEDFLEENDLTPAAVLLTHGHVDHIAGLNMLRQRWGSITVAIHADDATMLTNPLRNLSIMTGIPFSSEAAEVVFDKEESIEYAGLRFQVLHTPGHTPGGICLYCPRERIVFAGDALFAGSVGRTDFPGGNYDQLIESIREKLLTLPDDTTVYTGHGPSTTIADEKQANQYLV
ncbi:MAG: MBL fold metallo-hydrolase [Phycisphaerae bacterium]|nr:MBL fold metallo-hydrolase [Phycisphaerae bacterium]